LVAVEGVKTSTAASVALLVVLVAAQEDPLRNKPLAVMFTNKGTLVALTQYPIHTLLVAVEGLDLLDFLLPVPLFQVTVALAQYH